MKSNTQNQKGLELSIMKYDEFLQSKIIKHEAHGFDVPLEDLNPMLFDWQKVLVRWAIYKGRAALFEDCGLGKTPEQLEWAHQVHKKTGRNILIFAPLAVSIQTKYEGEKFGIPVNVCKSQDDVIPGINITNYERIEKFDPAQFVGVVLDESSILKNFAGKIRNYIINAFLYTPYKLCCTATPAPNDYMELGSTAEFLGIMTRAEMLSMYFINDASKTGTWRLKGYVKDNKFWEWVSTWAVIMQKPQDIGYQNNGFNLPPLNIKEHLLPFNGTKTSLFVEEARTLSERRESRKESIPQRLKKTLQLIQNNPDEIWLIWCNLNIESELLKKSIPGSVEIKGSDPVQHKEDSIIGFARGEIKTLITKSKISGFGVNWQVCNNVIFFGLSDSYEQFYQSTRRCWRFGQKNPVNLHIVIGEREVSVLNNVKRKEVDAQNMFHEMISYVKTNTIKQLNKHEIKTAPYNPQIKMEIPAWI